MAIDTYQNKKLNREGFAKRAVSLRQDGALWHPTLKEIAKYNCPTRGFFDDKRPNDGNKIDHKTVINSCAEEAGNTLASGMLSGLTSPSRPWVRPELDTDDQDLMEYTPVKTWLDGVQKWLLKTYAQSNVYGSLFSIYEELAHFGTACGFLQEDYREIVRMRVYTAGEYYYGCGADGRVNAFYHRFWKTVGQMIQEFGIENCTPQVQTAYKAHQVDQWRIINHLVETNDDRIPDHVDYKNMAFRSIYWEEGAPQDEFLSLGGYEEYPVLAPRWATSTTADAYGKGPGWKALGHNRMLQKMEKDYLLALAKVNRPPLQCDASVQGEVNTAPDGVTRFSAMTPNAGLKPAYQINPDLQNMQMKIEKTEAKINKIYFADLFMLLANAEKVGRDVTAYEIMEKKAEAMQILGPLLESVESELLNPMNDRTLMIGLRTGQLPPMSEEVAELVGGMNIKFKYISVLAQAQRMAGLAAIDQFATGVYQDAQVVPSAIDILDVDKKNEEKAKMLGIPATIVRDKKTMAVTRKARADAEAQAVEAAQAAQIAETANKGSAAVKNLSQAPVDNGQGSALDALIKGASKQ